MYFAVAIFVYFWRIHLVYKIGDTDMGRFDYVIIAIQLQEKEKTEVLYRYLYFLNPISYSMALLFTTTNHAHFLAFPSYLDRRSKAKQSKLTLKDL